MPSRYDRTCPTCRRTFQPDQQDAAFYTGATTQNIAQCRECYRTRANASRGSRGGATRGTGRRFGVEIEVISGPRSANGESSQHQVARLMTAAGVTCNVESYNHRVRSAWKIVQDASVYGGFELVSPILRGADGHRQVEVACRALREAGCSVNGSTGLHVHHDVRDLDTRSFGRLFRGWFNSQGAINGLVAASRRNGANSYCTNLTERDVAACESIRSMDRRDARFSVTRYRTLNVQSYTRYGTVEIRQHQGTINAAKINAWVKFGQAMIEWAKTSATLDTHTLTASLLETLSQHAGLDNETATYLASRALSFARPRREAALAS